MPAGANHKICLPWTHTHLPQSARVGRPLAATPAEVASEGTLNACRGLATQQRGLAQRVALTERRPPETLVVRQREALDCISLVSGPEHSASEGP